MERIPPHDQLLDLLSRQHVGKANAVSGDALAARMGCKVRNIRVLVLKLRQNAIAVCGSPETGYYIAATADEVDGTCRLLEAHALHQLGVAARMRKTTLLELLGQMNLST